MNEGGGHGPAPSVPPEAPPEGPLEVPPAVPPPPPPLHRRSFEELFQQFLQPPNFEEMNAADQLRNYWTTEPWFIDELIPFLALSSSQSIQELGSGRGLAALQFRYSSNVKSVTAYEVLRGRHEASLANKITFDAIPEITHRVFPPLELVLGDFVQAEYKDTLIASSVLFCAVDEDKAVEKYLKTILEAQAFGSRTVTNLKLVKFSCYLEDPAIFRAMYQVIKVEENESETRGKVFVTKKEFEKKNKDNKTSPEKKTPTKVSPKASSSKQSTPTKSKSPKKPKGKNSLGPLENPQTELWTEETYAERARQEYVEYKEPDADAPWFQPITPKNLKSNLQNTTRGTNFVEFYIITVTGYHQPDPLNVGVKWEVDDNGFVPYLAGTAWITCPMLVLRLEKKGYAVIQVIVNQESRLKMSLSVPRSQIYKTSQQCDVQVRARNRRVTVTQSGPTPTNIPANITRKSVTGMDYIFENLLPKNYIDILGIKPTDFKYLDRNGIHEEGMTFHLVDNWNSYNFFENINPYLEEPVLLTGVTATTMDISIPYETLSTLSFTLDNPEVYTPVGVIKTDELLYQTYSTGTVMDVFHHVNTELDKRGSPLAITGVPLHNHPDNYMFRGPEYLVAQDLCRIPPQPRQYLVQLNAYVDVVGKGSVQRWHCHMDGSTVWTQVAEGVKMYFFLLNPKASDYHHVFSCLNKHNKLKFIANTMFGRLVCLLVFPGDVLVFPGILPHAVIAITDVLAYGGRIVTTTSIPRLLEATKEGVRGFCPGVGYDYPDVLTVLFHGTGKIFLDLWSMKINKTKNFDKYGNEIVRSYSVMLLQYKEQSSMTEGTWKIHWKYIRVFFSLLQVLVDDTFVQTNFGGFYFAQEKDNVERNLIQFFEDPKKIPILTNVLEGVEYRSLHPPQDSDIDYYNVKNDNIRQRFKYTASLWYKHMLASVPKAVLSTVSGTLAVMAAEDLQPLTVVCEFTGELVTNSDVRQKYHNGVPYGNMYKLKTIYSKKCPPEPLFVDANTCGGMSLFLKTSDTPNCSLEPASVEGRVVLIVVTNQNVGQGEIITIPKPFKHGPRRPAVQRAMVNMINPEVNLVDRPPRVDHPPELPPTPPSSTVPPTSPMPPTTPAPAAAQPTPRVDIPPTPPSSTVPPTSPSLPTTPAAPAAPRPPAPPKMRKAQVLLERMDMSHVEAMSGVRGNVEATTDEAASVPTPEDVEEAIPEVKDPEPVQPDVPGPSVDLPDDQQPGPSRKMKKPSAIPRYVGKSKPTSNDSIAEDQSKPGKVKKAKSMPSLRNLKRGEPKEYKTEYSAKRGAQSENYENLRKYASSSDSEPGDEFLYKDIRLKRRDPPPIEENELAFARYRNRPLRIKQEIDRLEVAMFYHDLKLYKEVNENILRLYKVSSPYTCGLCSHLGLKKEKQAVALGFEEFTDHSHLIAHFWRFHYRRVECTICGEKTETARLMSGHQGKMIRAPNEAHRRYQEEERKKRQTEGKQNPAPAGGKKAAPKLKPKKFVTKAATVDKTSSEDDSTASDEDSGEAAPKRVTRQASNEGRGEKESAAKRKVPKNSKKPISADNDSADEEYDKEDKKRPKKKKRQDK